MGVNIFQVDAFTDKAFGGNPAGVVPCAEGLDENMMQLIAREMNVSETAFINKISEDLYKVRFFTPENEVDLCGHATIGAFYILAKKNYIKGLDKGRKLIYQDTKAGKLEVAIDYLDGEVDKVTMEQARPESFGGPKDLDRLAKSLNIELDQIGINGFQVGPEIISTGLKDIIIPIRERKLLDEISFNKELLMEVSRENQVVGVHLIHVEDLDRGLIATRNFAPLVGIDEEAATGTSNGASLYYLKKNKVLELDSLIASQGELMSRPSKIYCQLTSDGRIMVGGQAKLSIDGILMID